MMVMKCKKRVIGLVIVIIFLISGISSVSFIKSQKGSNTLKTPKTSTLQFDDEISETIYQNIDYEFSTVFYDDANYRNEYTSAYLQTELTSVSGYGFNDSISGVVNNFTEYAENGDITIINGNLTSTGTLDIKDANSTDIKSTQGGLYNATYSFTDDEGNPAGWTIVESGGSIDVVASSQLHSKVVELVDSTADVSMTNTFASPQMSETVEWWVKASQTDMRAWTMFYSTGNYLFFVGFYSDGSIRYYDGAYHNAGTYLADTWYHFRVDFNCVSDTFDFYVDDILEADDAPFSRADDGTGVYKVTYTTSNGIGTVDIDAVDYGWTAGYSEGRNKVAEDSTLDSIILIDGLNPHLSLEALEFELFSYYKTNESVNTKFYIYNFTDSGWDLLDDSVHLNFNDVEGVSHQTPVLEKFINASGVMKIRFLAYSDTVLSFMFSIDQLGVNIWTKLRLSHSRSFELSGLWKYRWYIIGSDYYSNWEYFNVKESISNFEAISESEYPTRWILYSNATSLIIDFHDNINTNAWNLAGAREDSFTTLESESYLFDNITFNNVWEYTETHFDVSSEEVQPTSITWDGTAFWVVGASTDNAYKYNADGAYTGTSFSVAGQETAPTGLCWDGAFFWVVGASTDAVYKYFANGTYTGTSFSVAGQETAPQGITWDGTDFWIIGYGTDAVYKYFANGTYTGTSFSVLGQDFNSDDIVWDGAFFWVVGHGTFEVYKYFANGTYTGVHFDSGSEDLHMYGLCWDGTAFWLVGRDNDEVYKYARLLNVFKNYFGSGYTYMQTNTTELISLLSSTYTTNYILSSGEYFEVDFQTNSDSLTNLILLRNGTIQVTLVLNPSGNIDFSRHTAQIIIDESVEFDQLKISSTFEDTDYVKIFDITTYNYTIIGDSADFSLGSKRSEKRILAPDNYSLSIYENGIKKVGKIIELAYDTLYQEIYQPIGIIECRVSLFSTDNVYLNFNEFRISVNRSLNGEYFVFWLLTNLLYVDKDTTLNFTIYDQFDIYIDSFIKVADPFIDLYIEVYILTIKNIMEEKTTLLLNSTNSYELLSHETIEFILPKGDYQLNWTDELGNVFGMVVYLDENSAYELNTSYYSVYFSLFNFDGLGLDPNLFRFYINGLRRDFGFNTLKQDTNTLKILDYFNATLFNSQMNLKQYTEYNINVEVYTMIIYNNYSFPVKLKIERNNIEFEQIIESHFGLSYRMLPDVEYLLRIYHLNGTLLEEKEVELDSNNKIVSFGFFETHIPVDPNPFFVDFVNFSIFLMIMAAMGLFGLFLYFRIKYQQKKLNPRIKRKKRKIGAGTYDDRGEF